jgi:hypothetical protein
MRRLIRSLITLALSAASLAALVLAFGAQPHEAALITAPLGLAPANRL